MTISAVLTLTLIAGQTGVVAEKVAHDSSQWEAAIARFEQQDNKEAPPAQAVLFVGSSSIRMWDLPKFFPDDEVINRGFGGSQMADVVSFAERIVIKYHPRLVVVYSGDNDIAAGKSAEDVHTDFCDLVEKIHEALPDTRIICISVKPSTARWRFREVMQDTNRLIAETCAHDERLKFIDVWPEMLGEDGQPRRELFLDDGLHMNHAGYVIWADLVRSHLGE
jgi:lysophospholipase L1-like esterase